MFGGAPGLAGLVLRLSIRRCIRELLPGLSSGTSAKGGSEKGLSDAVRICGGGIIGIMEPVGDKLPLPACEEA